MLREIAVPFVQQDLAPAETYAQLADSLEALVAASDSVIDRFIAHVARETDAIDKLSARVQAVEEQLYELAEVPGPAPVTTPGQLPEPSGQPPGVWQQLFSRRIAAEEDGQRSHYAGASRPATGDSAGSAPAEDARRQDAAASRVSAELYHVFKLAQQPNHAADLQADGPAIPAGLTSVAGMLLFGTDQPITARNESFDVALTHAPTALGPQQTFDLRSIASAATLPEAIPPELQSDYAPAAGGGRDQLGFLPGACPSPAINLPPVLPDLEHFAASSVSGRSHSLWSRRSSASGVTARRRTSLPAPGAPPLPPHPESPQAPAASRPRPEQPPDAAHPADVVPDAVADADSAAVAMQRSSTQPTDPGGGADRQQVSQASPAAGHDPQTHEQESATAAAAEHDGALQETARHADAPAPGTSPPRVPPLRLGSLGGGAARQPQAMQRVPPSQMSGSPSAEASHSTHAAAWALPQDTRDGGGDAHGVAAGSRQPTAAAAAVMARHGPSRSSSQRGSSPTAEAAAMGLQRSISHRQMSLSSKPSAESLQAGGGSGTHELPRLPGQTDGGSDVVSLRDFLRGKDRPEQDATT